MLICSDGIMLRCYYVVKKKKCFLYYNDNKIICVDKPKSNNLRL